MTLDSLHRRRLLYIALALIAVSMLAVQGIAWAFQPDGAYDWVMTPEAQIRTQAGECYVEGATFQEVCVQWCVITPEGHVLPQDRFACMPFNN